MNFPRGVLLVTALVFLVFGAWGFVAPAHMLAPVEVAVPTPTAVADARGQYGGFTLGMGVFLLACVARKDWTTAGLAAGTFTLALFALGRGLSAAVDGPVQPIIFALMGSEAAGAVLCAVAWRVSAK
jgi:hypothetical protein